MSTPPTQITVSTIPGEATSPSSPEPPSLPAAAITPMPAFYASSTASSTASPSIIENPDAFPPRDNEMMFTFFDMHQSIASATVASSPSPLP